MTRVELEQLEQKYIAEKGLDNVLLNMKKNEQYGVNQQPKSKKSKPIDA
jgi:hypothetical protein